MNKSYKEQKINQLVRTATDEIYGSISEADTGNYWINENWNIFCEKGYCVSGGEIHVRYYSVSLEQYDDPENCIDCQFDYQDTKGLTEKELEEAIRKIIERNAQIWTDS